MKRFILDEDNQPRSVDYFELTGQLQEGYLSDRLKEFVAYYSNRLSYEETEILLSRLAGKKLVSDQKIHQVVVAKAVVVSQAVVAEATSILQAPDQSLPAINPQVDIYAAAVPEVLLLDDGIQVKGQKNWRDRKNKNDIDQCIESSSWQSEEVSSASRVATEVMLLEKKEGGFEYMTEVIDAAGDEPLPFSAIVKSNLIKEYGDTSTPLNMVAITDGAKDIRLRLLAIFGFSITIILDWFHLTKKVRDLMSMIAVTKEDKVTHLKFLFCHLWQGMAAEVLHYLKTVVKSKNPQKLAELITYIENHQFEIIDYGRRKKAGKPIGSGRVEKGCDQVIGHRQKKKGMSWSARGSKSLGILKVVELNHKWQDLWFPQEAANDTDSKDMSITLSVA